MSTTTEKISFAHVHETTALERNFPIVEISKVSQQESWRKEINRPLYHIHKWWATRLGTVFRGINLAVLSDPGYNPWNNFYKIHHLTGKVVLDPFMGSGTTLGEAVKLGAKAIGCDINPISTFLVRQAFTRVSEVQLRAVFNHLENLVAPEIRRFYQTRDPESGKLIPVLYFFWVKTVITPDGETIPLFSRFVFSQDAYPKKKPKAQIICPECWNIIEDRYDAVDLSCPHCTYRFNPQIGPASGQYLTAKDGSRYRIKDLLPPDGSPPEHQLYAMMALRPNGEKVYLPSREEDLAIYINCQTGS
jgi:putative DNA methylase